MSAENLLILDQGDFSKRTKEVLDKLSSSPAYREWFVRDPAGAISSSLFAGQVNIPRAKINQGNRVLLALLSNRRFLDWSQKFQRDHESRVEEARRQAEGDPAETLRLVAATMDRSQIYREIIEASVKFLDQETLYGLLVVDREDVGGLVGGAAALRQANVAVEIETFVFAVVAVAVFLVLTQIDVTPVVAPDGVSRQDLQRISEFVGSRLSERAEELRKSGALTSLDAVTKGPIL